MVSQYSEEKVAKDIMSIEPLMKQTQQKLKNSTPQVEINKHTVSLITEAEIDAIKLNYTYDSDVDYQQHSDQRVILLPRCFLKNPHDIDFQKNLDAKCMEYGILPETVRPQIVTILQEKRNQREFKVERRKEYTSYYFHPLVFPFSQDNIYGFSIYGVVFYILLITLLVECFHWFYIWKFQVRE